MRPLRGTARRDAERVHRCFAREGRDEQLRLLLRSAAASDLLPWGSTHVEMRLLRAELPMRQLV